mgnify:CR=1 FL=1
MDHGSQRVEHDTCVAIGASPLHDRGRELAAGEREGRELSPERVAEVRRRILEGAYASAEVVGQVARAVLARGDL